MPSSVAYPKSSQGLLTLAATNKTDQYSPAAQLVIFFYLLGYNNVSFMGWLWVLITTGLRYMSTGFQAVDVHELTWDGLTIVQTAAIMEVIHSACGFVRAPVTTTAMQVASRLMLVWGVCYPFPEIRASPVFVWMVLAWSVADCTRYAYYGLNLIDQVPPGLTWARYNLFLVLYPVGVACELGMIYLALPYAQAWHGHPYYYYALMIAGAAYLPGFPALFKHMLIQRKKYQTGRYLVAEKKKKQKQN